ncbi:hypothetical protein RJ639_004006 [Escallonia herrerae]|uniref:Uncharacterized protein n=1 Tax=Escallonia herrerae TaxID=1293975 RepID=A0AA88W120_9ASTE|nr:hypothetical protein RJ639_004006 [Escallonia herrerae]
MKRFKEPNRVSWAPSPAPSSSQVRVFVSDGFPTKAGAEAQCHVRKVSKASWMDSQATRYEDPLKGRHAVHPASEKVSHIPRIKWKCPPKFALVDKWRVAAGEESEEVKVQKLREMRVLEAVYPHVSALPHRFASQVSL